MKAMKKLFAMLLATLMMVGMLATTAMADPITVYVNNDAPNHTYEAYQVFSGNLNAEGVLSNVQWGSGVNGTTLLAALKSNDSFLKDGVNMFSGAVDAEDVAQIITGWPYNEANIKNFADVVAANLTDVKATSAAQAGGKYAIELSGAGYYLIKDSGTLGTEGATDYLLQISNTINIDPKISHPTFEKTVNNSENGTYAKAIDAQIKDVVWFKLEAGLPSLLNDYKQFHAKFEDIVPTGLTPVEGSSSGKIYILHADATQTPLTATITRETVAGGTKLTLDLGDIKTQLGTTTLNLNDKIIIKYCATVNTNAVYGLDSELGNKNNAVFTFSNDMNQSSAPYSTAQLTSSASVYTYQAEFEKVDSVTKAPLQGAEFYLYRNVGSPAVKTYAHTNSEGLITEWSTAVPTQKLVSGADGKFVVKGLDALTYHLEEVTSPNGYNLMDEDVQITIESAMTGQELTSLSMTTDGVAKASTNLSAGLVTGQINNTAGTKLPTTGGIGTTIFYIVGGVLVLGAAAAFVMKRRNEA